MGKERANIGSIQEQGVVPVLEEAYRGTWCGALRITTNAASGTIWLVRGQAVHARLTAGDGTLEGMPALEQMALWDRGSYILDQDALPPGRGIRLPMADLILAARQSARRLSAHDSDTRSPRALHRRLDRLIETLRRRVPGLESISLINNEHLEATTTVDETEREWIGRQLKRISGSGKMRPETLYMKLQGRALLVIGDEANSTVLSAKDDTEPEAMFWAGKEAYRSMILNSQQSHLE